MIGGCLYVSIISFGIARRLRIHRKLNLWELSFDKRPVQGFRCEDPVIGAEKYNQGREKFKALASRHKNTGNRTD
ncbi:hypothetical protein J4731_20445 [Providencia rettgeri]|nr:hypothetical protein [Providencia rettgeri]